MPSQTGFSWRGFLLSLLHIRPGEWRWRVSLETAVVVGLPLLAFTLLGIGVFWLLTGLQPQGLWLVLTVCVLQFGIELFITRNYALGLLFITPLALLITTTSGSVPASQVMGLRLLDTVIGSVLALAVLFGLEWWHAKRLRRRLSA